MHVKSKLVPCSSDNHAASCMKQPMIDNLGNPYSSPRVSQVLDICSFFDQCFNTRYLQNKEMTISLITEECLSTSFNSSLEPIVDGQQHTCTSDTVNTDVHVHDVPAPPKKLKGLLTNLKNMEKEKENVKSTPMTHEQQVDNEISSYREFSIAEAETSHLVWWKAECRRFPTYSHLAMKYLWISGTNVPSERVFSHGGHNSESPLWPITSQKCEHIDSFIVKFVMYILYVLFVF